MIRCCALSTESFYRERYLQKSKEQEQLRKKLQSRAEEEIEELSNQKRTLERRVKKLSFLKFVINEGRLYNWPDLACLVSQFALNVSVLPWNRDLCDQIETDPSKEG